MLELKKKQVELMKVECAKAEMEMKIYELEENIIEGQEDTPLDKDKSGR